MPRKTVGAMTNNNTHNSNGSMSAQTKLRRGEALEIGVTTVISIPKAFSSAALQIRHQCVDIAGRSADIAKRSELGFPFGITGGVFELLLGQQFAGFEIGIGVRKLIAD